MGIETIYRIHCACGATDGMHTADCGCRRAEEFLAEPTAAYQETRRSFLRRALAGGLTLASLPLLGGAAEADIFTPSAKDQKQLGDKAAAEALRKYKEVNDDRARSFRRIGEKLVKALDTKERNAWNYRFRTVASKEVNAFALPGGNMFMFTGLIDRIDSDDELAAVTGHEMAHVYREHWAKAVAQQSKRELGLEILLSLTRANRTWRQVAGGASSLLTLQYSRGEEDQADESGLENMVAARYDPRGMLDLFRTLQSAGGGSEGPDFLRSHPLTKDRIARTQERIEEMGAEKEPR